MAKVARWQAALGALRADRLDEAYRLSDELARSTPPVSCARSLLGLVELRAGRLRLAQREFDAALEVPSDACTLAVAQAGTILAHMEAGNREGAYDALETLRESEPEHVLVKTFREPLRAELANEWLRRGRDATASPAAAAEALERALRFAPEAVDLQLELARLYRAAGAPDRALAAAKEAVLARPRHVPSLALYAVLLDEQNRLPEALDVCEKAAELAPLDPALAEHRRRLEHRSRLLVPERQLARIRGSGSLSREDLAAALYATLHDALASAPRRAVIVTDVQSSWARELVLESLALGLQGAYPGHVFEPGSRATTSEVRGALLRAARFIDSHCPRLEAGPCGNQQRVSRATELVEGALRGSPRITGAFVIDSAHALSRMAGSCFR